MGMFNVVLEDKERLSLAIETGYLEIIFENEKFLNEDVKIFTRPDNTKNYVLIRNKGTGGSSDLDIAHPATVKFIKGREFLHDGKPGLPFEVEEDDTPAYISPDADTPFNRSKLGKNDEKFVKLIVDDNRDLIREYWDLDKDNPEHIKRMNEIEKEIANKYGKKAKIVKSPSLN